MKTRNGADLRINDHDWEGGRLIDGQVASSNEVRVVVRTHLLGRGTDLSVALGVLQIQEVNASIELWWKAPDGVWSSSRLARSFRIGRTNPRREDAVPCGRSQRGLRDAAPPSPANGLQR